MKERTVFLDSSAWLKQFVAESGSERVAELCAAAETVVISELAVLELISTFRRLQRHRDLSASRYRILKAQMAEDLQVLKVIPLSASVVERALGVLEKGTLKASDSIHVASALAGESSLFVTADRQQGKASRLHGLKTELI